MRNGMKVKRAGNQVTSRNVKMSGCKVYVKKQKQNQKEKRLRHMFRPRFYPCK